jgi:hypothetical protein
LAPTGCPGSERKGPGAGLPHSAGNKERQAATPHLIAACSQLAYHHADINDILGKLWESVLIVSTNSRWDILLALGTHGAAK